MRVLSIVVAFIIAAQISLTLWFLFLSDRVRELETDVHDLEKKSKNTTASSFSIKSREVISNANIRRAYH